MSGSPCTCDGTTVVAIGEGEMCVGATAGLAYEGAGAGLVGLIVTTLLGIPVTAVGATVARGTPPIVADGVSVGVVSGVPCGVTAIGLA
ncbi:MAG: hypothetical protein ACOVN2_14115 [Usitatibacteraceae bacterium]